MTLITSPTGQFTAYWRPNLNGYFRQLSGYISTLPVEIAGDFLVFDGRVFEHHDLLHYEISLLDRIVIGNDRVSGIHGLCLPIFPDGPTVPEYDGLLDEARVAIHEWLTQPTPYNTCKLLNWFVWFPQQQVNPFTVLYHHFLSIRRYSGNVKEHAIDIIQSADRRSHESRLREHQMP